MENKKKNGFQPASNLDGSQIQSSNRKCTDKRTSKNSQTSTRVWIAFIIAGLLAVSFYCITHMQLLSISEMQTELSAKIPATETDDTSATTTETEINSESDSVSMLRNIPDFYTGENAKEAADSFMADNYLYYQFISEEDDEASHHFLYQIRDNSYYVSVLTPIMLSCPKDLDQPNYNFDCTYYESELEWHLDGKWYYSDASHNYYIKINRCEGNTLYAEYLFFETDDANEITYTQSSDGEVALQIVHDGDDEIHYYTIGDILMDIYPFGTTPDADENIIGISIDGVWLESSNES